MLLAHDMSEGDMLTNRKCNQEFDETLSQLRSITGQFVSYSSVKINIYDYKEKILTGASLEGWRYYH